MKTAKNGSIVNHFQGDYVKILVDVCIAAAVSSHHAIVIGLPGMGKTTVSKAALDKITGGRYLFKRINPSTPIEEIAGAYDPAALLNEGKMKRVIENTPYNPDIRGFVLDEVARGNEVMFDALLDVLDRQDINSIYDQAFCVATANFTIEGERANALKDRFALWVYLPNEDIDPEQFCNDYNPGQRATLGQELPTWDQIEAARRMTPGPQARAAVGNLINALCEAAAAQDGFLINNRRLVQWLDILYRVSFLITNDPNFAEVPQQAARLLSYAWPCQNESEAAQWQRIVAEITDLVGSAIDEIMTAAYNKFDEMAKAKDIDRHELLQPLGMFLTNCQSQLVKIGGRNNPRVNDAIGTLKKWFMLACNGESITR